MTPQHCSLPCSTAESFNLPFLILLEILPTFASYEEHQGPEPNNIRRWYRLVPVFLWCNGKETDSIKRQTLMLSYRSQPEWQAGLKTPNLHACVVLALPQGKGAYKPLPNTLFQGVPTPRLSDGMSDKLPIVPHIDFQSSQDHRSRGTPATYRSHIILIPSLGRS